MNLLKSRFHKDLTEIADHVKRQAENEFVLQYVDTPPIPQLRMQVLFLFLVDVKVPIQQIKQYVVPTILVQIGLDCHEKISAENIQTEREILTRQLSVLAGDYFSTKYYYLLSMIEDIRLIREIAYSIREINEAKSQIYRQGNLDAELYLDLINTSDSSLYTRFIGHFQAKQYSQWLGIMNALILVERLSDELLDYRWNNNVKGYLSRLVNQYTLPEACRVIQGRIQSSLYSVEQWIEELDNQDVKEELTSLVQEYSYKISYQA
jgi:heptaprenyl diphosphate synthase